MSETKISYFDIAVIVSGIAYDKQFTTIEEVCDYLMENENFVVTVGRND
ncbi:hypothetical protein [Robertmurraya siralis]|nr:hypothetical protein [Robertmurraya siralis]